MPITRQNRRFRVWGVGLSPRGPLTIDFGSLVLKCLDTGIKSVG